MVHQEARRQRAQAAAAQQEEQRQRAIQKAQEEAKLVAQIDAQNTLASASRKDRRKGAGSAPSQPSLAEDLLIGLWQAKLRDQRRDMSAGRAVPLICWLS